MPNTTICIWLMNTKTSFTNFHTFSRFWILLCSHYQIDLKRNEPQSLFPLFAAFMGLKKTEQDGRLQDCAVHHKAKCICFRPQPLKQRELGEPYTLFLNQFNRLKSNKKIVANQGFPKRYFASMQLTGLKNCGPPKLKVSKECPSKFLHPVEEGFT